MFGQSDWLDSQMGITDYGHRGVPNVFLRAPLLSDGPWNAAHFKNADYDKLVGAIRRPPTSAASARIAGKIQTLLLDETPIIFGYFFDLPGADQRKGVTRHSADRQPAVPGSSRRSDGWLIRRRDLAGGGSGEARMLRRSCKILIRRIAAAR